MGKKFKIKLTTDSGSDFLPFKNKFDCDILPIKVILNDEEFDDDGIQITPDRIYESYKKTNNLPKTSATSVYEFEEFFAKFANDYDAIIHIGISSGISVTVVNAKTASKKFKNVYVIDSKSLSTGTTLMLFKAMDLINECKSPEEIVKELNETVLKIQASFVIDSLEFLRKGGRCTMLQLLGANMFKIKPRLNLTDGKIISTKKYRGKQDAVIKSYLEDTLVENSNPDKKRCFITHTVMPQEWVETAIHKAKEFGFEEVYENLAGSTITSHCGEGTLGILFLNN